MSPPLAREIGTDYETVIVKTQQPPLHTDCAGIDR